MGIRPPVRVLIVDDSAVVRQILSKELSNDPGISVIGTASNPFVARDKILQEKPDVITLDLEMPRMDGLTFLRKLMVYFPLPVIVLSSLAGEGTKVALDSLELGAVEVFAKPKCDIESGLKSSMLRLCEAVKCAAVARVARGVRPKQRIIDKLARPTKLYRTTDKVIAIGASTGGTEAIKSVLTRLPADSPGVLAVVHMPEGFTARYAERLNQLCEMEVREAQDGDSVHSGIALIARGNNHLLLERSGAHYYARVRQGPEVHRQRPSVEVLFHSVAEAAGANAMGVILTGMGRDGADGLRLMHDSGAYTVAQDEATCVVFGMPKEAIQAGAVDDVLPMDSIAQSCVRWFNSTEV
jgi:two-component system chemotaxis response regulator CheB